MNISEKQLREAIIRAIAKIEAEEGLFSLGRKRQKIYMVCAGDYDDRYLKFLHSLKDTKSVAAVPVLTEELRGQESRFMSDGFCEECIYLDRKIPSDLEHAVTVFPVVPRDLVIKTALCISDTLQTQWITSCMEAGSRIIFLTSGLSPFTGREPKAYVNRILSYYRTVLEYGIEISKEFKQDAEAVKEEKAVATSNWSPAKTWESVSTREVESVRPSGLGKSKKKRVISSRDVEKLQRGGVLIVGEDDIITDLARDRAKFLHVTFKTVDEG